jgi:phosphatidate cytidylyltransferase
MYVFLKSLTPDQQVGAMFFLVFGCLLVVHAIAFLASLREHQDEDKAAWVRREQRNLDGILRTSWVMMGLFWLAWLGGDSTAIVLFGLLSFFALREFMTLSPTRRGDHRSLVLAFFVVLPVQYGLVATEHFDLFSVFIPVYVFLAIPVVSALAGDPHRFLERNAKLQWGIMVCIYGMSHVPALLLLEFPRFDGKAAFLVFFLVITVQLCVTVQHLIARYKQWPPSAPQISQSFNWRAWLVAIFIAGLAGAVLSGITPFPPAQGFVMAIIASAAGTMGHFVMKALKRDRGVPSWGGHMASVTGAGGILERVDALCFAAPVFFHFLRWYFNL